MQIIIPMAGVGQRFLDAGYKTPKPLLDFDGKPMIEHIVGLFPGEDNFIFVCNNDHLKRPEMKKILKKIAPKGRVFGIDRHKKGPVYTISKIFDHIVPDKEVIIHYCDVSKHWDYRAFLNHVHLRKADGALSGLIGFHPHTLRGTNYALMSTTNQWLDELVEKKPLEDMNKEYISDGLYYFASGNLLKKYFQLAMDEDVNVNGEYYASVVYNLMKRDGLKITVFESEHLMSAQNPLDYKDHKKWSACFKRLTSAPQKTKPQKNSVNLTPLAGRGSRFVNEGYKVPKPLIEVNGDPMIIQASYCLPQAEEMVFVCLAEHLDNHPLEREIKKIYPRAKIVKIDKVTEGQACTIEIAAKGLDPDAPMMVGTCDNGMLYDEKKYQALLDDESVDAIAWTFRREITGVINPKAYAWLEVDEDDNVKNISVKVPISEDTYNDHAFTGLMYFRKTKYFLEALKDMYKNNTRINNEFYLDTTINSLIKMGKKVKVFELDYYIGWGTPNDLRTFEYWQRFFDRSKWHPYSLEKDFMIDKKNVSKLNKKYNSVYKKSC